jgi:hypothetical protein
MSEENNRRRERKEQIDAKIQEHRNAIAALDAEALALKDEEPKKVLTRSHFDSLSHADRAAKMKEGYRVING